MGGHRPDSSSHRRAWRHGWMASAAFARHVGVILHEAARRPDPLLANLPGRHSTAPRPPMGYGSPAGPGRPPPCRLAGVLVGTLLLIIGLRVHDAWKSTIGRFEPTRGIRGCQSSTACCTSGTTPGSGWPRSFLQPPFALDALYVSWYPLLVVGLVWQLWNADRRARTQFFVAFALTWVLLGTVLAHLLASAGLVFYAGLVQGSNPYLPLTEYLWCIHGERPLTAVVLQHIIWKNYIGEAHQLWMGMSAMPSLHLAMPALFACAAWGVSRTMGIAVWTYTVLILIASVQLGWHYAVDGYASILLVGLIWRLSHRVVGRPRGEDPVLAIIGTSHGD
jgi:hypothetical protein